MLGVPSSTSRTLPSGGLAIAHAGVPRVAGEIAAHRTFWLLSNLGVDQTYVVENPEGAGKHIKVGPGRVEAPVPFEPARVTLPAAGDLLTFDVWAPRHAFRSIERHGLLRHLHGIPEVGEVDGDFGPKTRSGVVIFQERAGLAADGIVGPATWRALRKGGES